ncbi:hypothetical protein B0O80DRAFT_425852 [Mortierella sp. GBAus27b]|nr:hypothetical protein B0O80DRAFT_425852 [Mortierella sp. GBAus27b]
MMVSRRIRSASTAAAAAAAAADPPATPPVPISITTRPNGELLEWIDQRLPPSPVVEVEGQEGDLEAHQGTEDALLAETDEAPQGNAEDQPTNGNTHPQQGNGEAE